MKIHHHPIDDFFREAIKDHQMAPSEKAREAFLRDIMQTPPPVKKRGNGWPALALLLLLSFTGLVAWYLYAHNQAANHVIAASEQVNISPKSLADKTKPVISGSEPLKTTGMTRPATTSPAAVTPTIKTIQPENKKLVLSKNNTQPINHPAGVNENQTAASPAAISGKTPREPSTTEPVNDPSTGVNPAGPDMKPAVTVTLVAPDAGTAVKKPAVNGSETRTDNLPLAQNDVPSHPGNTGTIITPDTLKPVEHKETKPALNPAEDEKSRYISAGIFYSPEWMFNTLEGEKFVNTFGVEGTFHFGPFSIRTGAGLSVTQGTNELSVEYNDLVGTYNNLDSMTFAWNSATHNYITKMYMTPQDVWDSLMKLDYPKVVKRYTYLQIPMIMGYDFWRSGRISMGVRVGPVLSILLSSKQLSDDYQSGNKRIVRVNDITPEQESLNWQAMAGFNLSVRLTKQIQFEAEPAVKYYFNSVYEKPGTTWKPFSAGLRAAFVFKL